MLELNLPKKSYNVGLWTFTGHLGALSFLGQGRAKFVWPRGHLRIKHRACMPMGPDMSLSKNHTTLMGVSRQLWKQTNKQTKKKTNPNIACYPFFFIQVFRSDKRITQIYWVVVLIGVVCCCGSVWLVPCLSNYRRGYLAVGMHFPWWGSGPL